MKRIMLMGLMIAGLNIAAFAHVYAQIYQENEGYQDQALSGEYSTDVSFQSDLMPYGEWIQSDYGQVWRPFGVSRYWRPYQLGRWVWTDYGWYWESSEPFGWATYHYGRWQYDDYYGWIWIPNNVWGPAWVEWRYNDDYIGWAPLTPYATFDFSVGVTLTHGWIAPVHYWNFVPCRNFTAVRAGDYVQPVEQTRRFFGSTRGVANIRGVEHRVVNRGIDVSFIERKSGYQIKRLDVVNSGRINGERILRDPNSGRSGPPTTGDGDLNRRSDPVRTNNGGNLRQWKDAQPVRIPNEEGSRRSGPTGVRQYRESEQRFEIPKLSGTGKNRQDGFADWLQKRDLRNERTQQRTQDRPAQSNPRTDQNVRGTGTKQSENSRPATQDVKPQPQEHRNGGRRP